MGKKMFFYPIIFILTHILKVEKKFQKAFIHMKRHWGLNFAWFASRDIYILIIKEAKPYTKSTVCEKKKIEQHK